MVTQALTYLAVQLLLTWYRNGYTSVDLPCGATVTDMVQEWLHKR